MVSLRSRLSGKGVFSHPSRADHIPAQFREEVLLWRRVIDESLLAALSANTSAKAESLDWVTYGPGQIKVVHDYVYNPKTRGYIRSKLEVEPYAEFVEVCENAALDPEFVREQFLKLYQTETGEKLT